MRPLNAEERRRYVRAMFIEDAAAECWWSMNVEELIEQAKQGNYGALIILYIKEKHGKVPDEESKFLIDRLTYQAIDNVQKDDSKFFRRVDWQSKNLMK